MQYIEQCGQASVYGDKKIQVNILELGLLQVVGTVKTVLSYLRAGVAHVMDLLRD